MQDDSHNLIYLFDRGVVTKLAKPLDSFDRTFLTGVSLFVRRDAKVVVSCSVIGDATEVMKVLEDNSGVPLPNVRIEYLMDGIDKGEYQLYFLGNGIMFMPMLSVL